MIYSKEIQAYLSSHSSAIHPILDELERETHLKYLMPNMLSGREQGMFLNMLVSISQAKHIVEIGTYTGYAALCMACALPEDGMIQAFELNPELEEIILRYFKKAGLENKLKLHIGDAKKEILKIDAPIDLVFIDADKQGYSAYYDIIFDRVKSGGLIIADNVLWNGKVVESNPNTDTQALIAFNQKVQSDERVENMILPLRDGLLMIRKK